MYSKTRLLDFDGFCIFGCGHRSESDYEAAQHYNEHVSWEESEDGR